MGDDVPRVLYKVLGNLGKSELLLTPQPVGDTETSWLEMMDLVRVLGLHLWVG